MNTGFLLLREWQVWEHILKAKPPLIQLGRHIEIATSSFSRRTTWQ